MAHLHTFAQCVRFRMQVGIGTRFAAGLVMLVTSWASWVR